MHEQCELCRQEAGGPPIEDVEFYREKCTSVFCDLLHNHPTQMREKEFFLCAKHKKKQSLQTAKHKLANRSYPSKLNINMDADTKTRWVAYCKAHHFKQSSLLTEIVKNFLDEQEKR